MRKAKPKKRVILPDPVFNDQKVSKFVNHLMYDGKKNASYEIFYKSLDVVKEKMANEEKSPLEIWKQALDNIVPRFQRQPGHPANALVAHIGGQTADGKRPLGAAARPGDGHRHAADAQLVLLVVDGVAAGPHLRQLQ